MARIMVVEDEPTAMDLEQMLVGIGHEVVGWVDAGEDAVEKARQLGPDLVLMDIRLQGAMTGIEASERIRHESVARGAPSVPVVFLTAFADRDTVDRACRTSPYGYLVKPFTEEAVVAAVQVALARRDDEREAREHESFLRSTLRIVDEALVAVDTRGRVRFVNPPALALLATDEASLVGRPFATTLRDPTTNQPLELLRRAIGAGEVVATRGRLTTPSGAPREVAASAGPVLDGDGRLLGAVLALREAEPSAPRSSVGPSMEGAPSSRMQHDINTPLTCSLVGIAAALRELDALRALHSVSAGVITDELMAAEGAALQRVESALRSAEEGATRIATIMRGLRAAAPGPVNAKATDVAPDGRRARVLVVDDEPMIGRILEVTLRPLYDVTVVNSAERALELIEGGGAFDVVLSDLMMPGLSGRDLYEHLSARHPDLARRMIVMSGGARDERGAAFLDAMAGRRLDKPFRADELHPLIARCVESTRTVASGSNDISP